MSYKFILDTNVLQPEPIKKLRAANLNDACLSGRLAFYVTPVLLKERLDFIIRDFMPNSARESIEYFISLKWQRFFRELGGSEGIYTMELEGRLRSEYLFDNRISYIRENLLNLTKGGRLSLADTEKLKREKEEWDEKKQKNKETYCIMREDINKKLNNDSSLSRKETNFSSFLKENFEKTAIEKIKNSINSMQPKECLVEYWKGNKNRCPYFNKYVEGWLYIAWYAMAPEQTPKIDINSCEDIEHLIYLNNVDCIVSNEKGFLKKAYEELFPERAFLSVDRFVARIQDEKKLK